MTGGRFHRDEQSTSATAASATTIIIVRSVNRTRGGGCIKGSPSIRGSPFSRGFGRERLPETISSSLVRGFHQIKNSGFLSLVGVRPIRHAGSRGYDPPLRRHCCEVRSPLRAIAM